MSSLRRTSVRTALLAGMGGFCVVGCDDNRDREVTVIRERPNRTVVVESDRDHRYRGSRHDHDHDDDDRRRRHDRHDRDRD